MLISYLLWNQNTSLISKSNTARFSNVNEAFLYFKLSHNVQNFSLWFLKSSEIFSITIEHDICGPLDGCEIVWTRVAVTFYNLSRLLFISIPYPVMSKIKKSSFYTNPKKTIYIQLLGDAMCHTLNVTNDILSMSHSHGERAEGHGNGIGTSETD